jgi:predicted ester cyclase
VLRADWPDIRDTVEDQVAEGDKVVTRWTARATHTQTGQTEFGPIAPTQKQMSITGINIQRISGGRLVERWSNQDDLGLMQQLGAIPQMAQTRT